MEEKENAKKIAEVIEIMNPEQKAYLKGYVTAVVDQTIRTAEAMRQELA